jgi:hypothetical protein
MKTTRRRLLKYGLGGAGLLAVGSAAGTFTLGYRLHKGEVAIGLSKKEMCVVRALVQTLLPGEDGLPSGIEVGVVQRIDEEIWSQSAEIADDLRAALHLLEHAAPAFGGFFRFSKLSREKRVQVFDRFLKSSVDVVAQAAYAFKQMAHLFYYGHEKVWPLIGYDGPWMPVAKPPASSLAYQERLAAAPRGAGA